MTGQSGWRAVESWPIRLEGHEKVTDQSDSGCTISSSWIQIKRAKNLVKQIFRANWTFRTGLFKRSGLLVLVRFITDHFSIDQFVWMICSTKSDPLKRSVRKVQFARMICSIRLVRIKDRFEQFTRSELKLNLKGSESDYRTAESSSVRLHEECV